MEVNTNSKFVPAHTRHQIVAEFLPSGQNMIASETALYFCLVLPLYTGAFIDYVWKADPKRGRGK